MSYRIKNNFVSGLAPLLVLLVVSNTVILLRSLYLADDLSQRNFHAPRFLCLKMTEQRICIKFCVKNGFKCSEVLEMLFKAFGENAMSKTTVYEWYKRYKEGREDVEDNAKSGRPSTSMTVEIVKKIKEIVLSNRRITIREVAEEIGISFGSCHAIFKDTLGLRRVAAKFVPKLLNFQQKLNRKNISEESLAAVNEDPNLIKRIITGDETWVYGYDVETKAQSSQWKRPDEPRPKKARQVRSNVKVLLTVFFDYNGIVHYEFLPTGRTVNKEYYLEVLRRLREKIRQKRPDLWAEKSWILHHDNAPAHASLLIRSFLAKNGTIVLQQPPYSPDLAPCDFFLFPKMKRTLKGQRFDTIDIIKQKSWQELKAIPKEAFVKCFEEWKKRWHKCIISEGDYFEGDHINIDE